MTVYRYTPVDKYIYPIIPVIIPWNEVVLCDAIIDSGAMISLFHPDIAEAIGLDIESGEKSTLGGISDPLQVFIHRVRVKINSKEFILKIAFSKDYKSSFNILGRSDFFNKFKICFDEKNNEFSVI